MFRYLLHNIPVFSIENQCKFTCIERRNNYTVYYHPDNTGYFLFVPLVNTGESSNGRTTDFDSVYLGSNPSSPNYILHCGVEKRYLVGLITRRQVVQFHPPQPNKESNLKTYAGMSSNGRTTDSESVYLGSSPSIPRYTIFHGNAGMMELVDMLGLEPSALRCAGSSPVPGKVKLY